MEPTNTEPERMLHKVVICYKIRQKLATVGRKIMLGTIMTCLLTWDKLGLNWLEKLSEVFWTTWPFTKKAPEDIRKSNSQWIEEYVHDSRN